MSFILDALRKSEHERQRQTGPGIADLRPVVAQGRFPVWAIAIGVLLLVNIVVVVVLVMRNAPVEGHGASEAPVSNLEPRREPAASPRNAPAATSARSSTPSVPASVFSTEGLNAPAAPVESGSASGRTETRSATAVSPPAEEPEILEPLPTIDEMAARGVALPELHLDIHVFVARQAGRFVFINQRKYREGARLPEGPVIEQITREGVVLSYGGSRFLMPRP